MLASLFNAALASVSSLINIVGRTAYKDKGVLRTTVHIETGACTSGKFCRNNSPESLDVTNRLVGLADHTAFSVFVDAVSC